MTERANPWAQHFLAVNDIDVIRQRTRVRAAPLCDLERDAPRVACERIRKTLQEIFYPTQRSCEIIQEIVQAGLAHAQLYHADSRAHLARAYLEKLDIEPYVPLLLTGLAGTGKTQIRKAVGRLFADESTVKLDAGHGRVPLVPLRSVAVQSRNRLSLLLQPLASPEVVSGAARVKVADLPAACAHWLYLTGTCMVVVDELQFLTQSRSANTLIAQALLAITYVRTPALVVANYRVGHRLKQRPSEELQRLLGNHIVLLPDPPNSADWFGVLREYQRAVPGVFSFDFVKQADSMWALCAGIKRELVALLILAYAYVRRAGRIEVSWQDVESAYTAPEFSTSRRDIEMLIRHGVGSSALREDLRCPFPIPVEQKESFGKSLKDARDARVAAATLDASLTQPERAAKELVERLGTPSDPAPMTSPRRSGRRKGQRTAASLKEAGERFRKGL